MSENLKLIGKKLEHLARMRTYLDYSTRKMQGPLEKIRGKGLDALTPEEHDPEILFQFFNNLVRHVPVLLGIHDRLKMFVERTYGSSLSIE